MIVFIKDLNGFHEFKNVEYCYTDFDTHDGIKRLLIKTENSTYPAHWDEIEEFSIVLMEDEQYNRYTAIKSWLRGEDVFEVEVEKPKKWIVRSKEHDEGGHYQYVKAGDFGMSFNKYNIDNATKFATKEQAQSWSNDHQDVIEVKE